MTNFFRKARFELAHQNQFFKYTRYAIGEIVLVVIGILIALQINNLNRDRLDAKKEKQILQNLKKDLIVQNKLLDFHIEFEGGVSNSAKYFLQNYSQNNGFSYEDSIYNLLNDMTIRSTFEPTNATYQELISTGNVGLIDNDKLKMGLIEYYQNVELIALKIQNNNSNLIDGIMNPIFYSLTLFDQYAYSKEMAEIIMIDNVKKDFIRSNRLKAISKEQLSIPKNELLLINLVNFRLMLANFHKNSLIKLKKETELLMEKVDLELSN